MKRHGAICICGCSSADWRVNEGDVGFAHPIERVLCQSRQIAIGVAFGDVGLAHPIYKREAFAQMRVNALDVIGTLAHIRID